MSGMAIAVVTTAALIVNIAGHADGLGWVLLGLVMGGGAGAIMAQRVEMTKMPELVAFMHSMIGLAAVFIAIAAVVEPAAFGIVAQGMGTLDIPNGNRLELFLGAAIGAITFSGSVIAFGKLSGKYKFRLFQGAPVVFAGQHMLNLVMGLATVGLGRVLHVHWQLGCLPRHAGACLLCWVCSIIIPIGGADMPVVVSMLNSYSGWAAAGIGFSLEQQHVDHCGLAGGLVGCHPELHHVQGHEPLVLQRHLGWLWRRGRQRRRRQHRAAPGQKRQRRRCSLYLGQCRNRGHRARLRLGRGPCPARGERVGRKADPQRHHGEIRHPPGGRAACLAT
jgi:NAD(P) transhydrogenase subunit beta